MAQRPSSGPPAAEEPADTRGRLIEAGLDVFGESGYDPDTTRPIAEKARGKPAPNPYHFRRQEGTKRDAGGDIEAGAAFDAHRLQGDLLVGPAEKDVGRLTVTVNPIFEKEVGDNASKTTEFKYAARVKWRLMPQLEPAIEAYGDIGEIRRLDPSNAQRHQIGPVLLGKFRLGDTSALRYEAGYLFGLTSGGSPDGAFKWLLELEHYF